MKEGIESLLEVKFGAAGLALMPEIRQLHNTATLEEILKAAKTATEPAEVRRIWSQPS